MLHFSLLLLPQGVACYSRSGGGFLMKHVAYHGSVWSVFYWKLTSVFKTTECFVAHRKLMSLYVTNAFVFVQFY